MANHWQDLSIDLEKDRLYIPKDLLAHHGLTVEQLKEWKRGPLPGGFRRLMGELVGRARALFDEGEPLLSHLSGRLRLELRLTVLGGRAILDRIEEVDYDLFRHRPVLSLREKLNLLGHAVLS